MRARHSRRERITQQCDHVGMPPARQRHNQGKPPAPALGPNAYARRTAQRQRGAAWAHDAACIVWRRPSRIGS